MQASSLDADRDDGDAPCADPHPRVPLTHIKPLAQGSRTVSGALSSSFCVPAITVARKVNVVPARLAGHLITPVRLPSNGIHVPALGPEHRAIAVALQQPTTRARRRSCSRTLAASGFPAWSSTRIV